VSLLTLINLRLANLASDHYASETHQAKSTIPPIQLLVLLQPIKFSFLHMNNRTGARITQVSIAAGYGLDSEDSTAEHEIFLYSTASRLTLGLTQLPI
jgi:hypothetical protein